MERQTGSSYDLKAVMEHLGKHWINGSLGRFLQHYSYNPSAFWHDKWAGMAKHVHPNNIPRSIETVFPTI